MTQVLLATVIAGAVSLTVHVVADRLRYGSWLWQKKDQGHES